MPRPSAAWKLLLACAGLLGLVACGEPSTPEAKGSARFASCAPCHGATGGGDVRYLAPPIGGLPAWYVEDQILKYRAGVRGVHPDDLPGMRMRPMSLTLPTDADVHLVAVHVSTLPKQASVPTLEGADAARGAIAFPLCTACHMADGSGMEALKAPPIAGMPDWYVYEQLHKFKGGVRGAHPDDVSGGQMRAISLSIPDEQAMKDLAAYTSSLPRK